MLGASLGTSAADCHQLQTFKATEIIIGSGNRTFLENGYTLPVDFLLQEIKFKRIKFFQECNYDVFHPVPYLCLFNTFSQLTKLYTIFLHGIIEQYSPGGLFVDLLTQFPAQAITNF